MFLQLSHLDAGPSDPLEDRGRQEMRFLIATSLGLPASKVKDTDDFFKLGGDSLSAVLCVARLRAAGRSIDVQTFSTTPTIGDLLAMLQPDIYVRQSSEREEGRPGEEEFELSVMKDSDSDVSCFIAQCFTQRDILCTMTNCAYEDLAQWLEDIRPKAVESGASLLIRRKADNRLMAATLSFDYHEAPAVQGSPALSVIGAFFDECLDPKVQPEPNDRWLFFSMLATEDDGLSGRHRLQFVEDLERETVRKAKDMGFTAIETINTSEVTSVSFEGRDGREEKDLKGKGNEEGQGTKIV